MRIGRVRTPSVDAGIAREPAEGNCAVCAGSIAAPLHRRRVAGEGWDGEWELWVLGGVRVVEGVGGLEEYGRGGSWYGLGVGECRGG